MTAWLTTYVLHNPIFWVWLVVFVLSWMFLAGVKKANEDEDEDDDE
jgi:hypothetical protein